MKSKGKTDPRKRRSQDGLGLFRAIFEMAAVGVAQIETATGRFLHVNQRYADIVGCSRAELERLDIRTLVHPEDLPADLVNLQRLLAGEIREFTTEKRYQRRDGKIVWVNLTVSALWPPGERPGTHIAVVEDITGRKLAEAALRESDAQLRLAVDRGGVGLWVWQIATGQLTWNDHLKTIFGLPSGATGLTLDKFVAAIHPEDRAGTERAFRQALEDRAEFNHEYRILWPDGTVRWIVATGRGEYDASGQPVRMQGAALDVTARRRMESELQERVALAEFTAAVGSALTGQGELRALLQGCAQSMVDTLGGAFARIWTLNEKEQVLELQASAGLYTHLDGGHARVPVGQFKSGLIAQERKPHMTNQVIGDPRVSDQEWAGREGMVAFAGYPLLVEDRVVGVMMMFARHPLAERHLQAMAAVSHSIATTIERKRAERELAQREQRLNFLLTGTPAVIYTSRPSGDYGTTFVSANVSSQLGFQPREFVEDPAFWLNHIHPDDRERVLTGLGDLLTGDVRVQEYRFRHQDGAYRWMLDEVRMLYDAFGQPAEVIGCWSDITARKLAETALQASEAEHRLLVQHLNAGVVVHGADTRILLANEQASVLLGLSQEQMQGKAAFDPAWSFVREDESPMPPAEYPVNRVVATRQPLRDLIAGINRPSTQDRVWVLINAFPELDEAGGLRQVVVTFVDITERKRTEEALKEREEYLRTIVETEPECVKVLDRDGSLLEMNAAGLAILEASSLAEMQARGLLNCILPEYQGAFRVQLDRVREGETGSLEFEIVGLRGTRRWLEMRAAPMRDARGNVVRILGVTRDITKRKLAEMEREKLQAQLTQAQKMESVGRLAGGVAHDFNNMLQAILGNASLTLELLPPDSRLRENLEEIQRSAERSADLTRQLLAFARKQTIAPRVLDLNDTVAGMLKMLRRMIGEDIDLAWMPGANLWPVEVDPSQIDQILANLCVNARDAIAGTGKVTIETENVTLDEHYAATHPDCSPGDYVMFAVSDSGTGMDAVTKSHLFEPFFTTKGVGKGTGLGLATVFGIVKQNKGLINVYSELGQGTTFKIYLPRAEDNWMATEPEDVGRALEGNETVLVVEDEEQVLNLCRLFLQRHGYTVLTASSPAAALALVAQYQGPIHLLITDVVMPGMNGRELRERLLASHPDQKCLFISGYSASVIAHHGVLDENVDFLEKPFTNLTLAEKVKEILTREAPE